jgi:alpha-ketoglutarate-dependent 2,4-dichlorophenoxyacetate dioxygenase
MDFTQTIIARDFVADCGATSLRECVGPEFFRNLAKALEACPVLVFRNQPFSDEEQVRFAERLSGQRGHCFLSRMTNLDDRGQPLDSSDFRRTYTLATRLWHTDGSCGATPSKYSMLSAKVVPPRGGETEFADMCRAYESLGEKTKHEIEWLHAEHARAYSRHLICADPINSSDETIAGVAHRLVYERAETKRKSLYLSSNASKIIELPIPDGRLLLKDLIEHATQAQFVYRHAWHVDDLVIWDNLLTMHRSCRYDDLHDVRDLRRTTTPDVSGG